MTALDPLASEQAQRAQNRTTAFTAVDRFCTLIAGLILFGMMTMTVIDVAGRYLFNAPLSFAYEVTQLAMAMLVLTALPSVTIRMEHVTAGLFEGLWRGRGVLLRDALVLWVSASACAFAAFRLTKLALRFDRYGDQTSVLHLPIGPFTWAGVGFLYLVAALAVLAGLSRLIRIFKRDSA